MTRRTNGWHRQNRNSPAARARRAKYNTREHREAVAAGKRLVPTGRAICWRCHHPIPPTAVCGPGWQVGHDDTGTRIMGPEHTTCNRRAAAQAGNHKRQTLYPHLNWTRKTKPIRPHAL